MKDGRYSAMNRVEPSYPDAKSPSSFQDGLEFQDFVCTTLAAQGIVLQNLSSRKYQYDVGENLQGFEIKLDSRCTDTMRLSIEVAEKTRDDSFLPWTPSGICRDDNSWLYIQGNYQVLFVFAKNWLNRYYTEKRPEVVQNRPTIKTFFLPFSIAKRCAAKVIEINGAG